MTLHEVVQVDPLHAKPAGQSLATRQRVVHAPPRQTWPDPQTCPTPQPPQLPGSLVKSTQAPLQSENPWLHAKEQELAPQTGWALATPVAHGRAHAPQLAVSLVVSTHAPLHRVGAAAGHPEAHA